MATATMDDLNGLISAFHGRANVNTDLQALQEYLEQNLSSNLPNTTTPVSAFRPLPPSRSTSTTRPSIPPQSSQNMNLNLNLSNISQSNSENSTISSSEEYGIYGFNQPFPSPLVQTPYPGEDPNQSSSRSYNNRAPYSPGLKRSSSYGFSNMPEMSNSQSGFESDAFAPLIQDESNTPHDPWARLKQASILNNGLSQNQNKNPWAGFGAGGTTSGNSFGTGNNFSGFGGFGNNQSSSARYQSPVRSKNVMHLGGDDDDEDMGMDTDADMGDSQMDDETLVNQEIDRKEMNMDMDRQIVRVDSAPAAFNAASWGHDVVSSRGWERGRRKM